MNRVKGMVLLIIFGLLCVGVVIHAGLKANEIVIPEDKKAEVVWDVVFTPDPEINEVEVNYTDGVEFTTPQLFDSIVNDFDVSFKKPQQEISFTFYMKNNSEYDAYILHYNEPIIKCVNDNDLCISNLDKIEYTVMYEDDTKVKLNDVLKSQEEKKVIIKIKYKKNKEEVPMNLTQLGFSLTFAKVK